MKTFTIDSDNNITIHDSRKAARDTGSAVFATEEQFSELIGPDNKRLVEIWNSLPGVKPVIKFTSRKIAIERIWKALQSSGEQATAASAPQVEVIELEEAIPAEFAVAEPATIGAEVVPEPEAAEAEPARPEHATTPQAEIEPAALTAPTGVIEPVADTGARLPREPPAELATEDATPAKKARKAKNGKNPEVPNGPREGSKTALVVAMLQRESGATIDEIMQRMGWQKHTVRGFMAGAMKKAGYAVESFRSESGIRSYRINK